MICVLLLNPLRVKVKPGVTWDNCISARFDVQ